MSVLTLRRQVPLPTYLDDEIVDGLEHELAALLPCATVWKCYSSYLSRCFLVCRMKPWYSLNWDIFTQILVHLINNRSEAWYQWNWAVVAGIPVVGFQGQVIVCDEDCGRAVVEPHDWPIHFVQRNYLAMKMKLSLFICYIFKCDVLNMCNI